MREKYAERAGCVPEDASDIGIRLHVLAGELYRLAAEIEWIKRQAFPQTADGAQLDLHGAERGVKRLAAQPAQGILTFSRYIPIDFDLLIPKGTICACHGEEAVEYETTEEGVLQAGQVAVEVPARALLGGSGGNAAAGYINTLVSAVEGINYVTNTKAFTGGTEEEDDEPYRERILEAYGNIIRPGNAFWYEEQALMCEGIAQTQAVPREDGPGTVTVYVWGDREAPQEQVITDLQEELNGLSDMDISVRVKAAATKKMQIAGSIKVCQGGIFSSAKAAAIEAIKEHLLKKKIGDPVYLGDIERAVLGADRSISRVVLNSSVAEIPATPGVLPIAGGIIFSEAQ